MTDWIDRHPLLAWATIPASVALLLLVVAATLLGWW